MESLALDATLNGNNTKVDEQQADLELSEKAKKLKAKLLEQYTDVSCLGTSAWAAWHCPL